MKTQITWKSFCPNCENETGTQLSLFLYFKDKHDRFDIFKFLFKNLQTIYLDYILSSPQTAPYLSHLVTHLTWWFFFFSLIFRWQKIDNNSPVSPYFLCMLCILVILILWSVFMCYWGLALVIYISNNLVTITTIVIIAIVLHEILSYFGNFKKVILIVIMIN